MNAHVDTTLAGDSAQCDHRRHVARRQEASRHIGRQYCTLLDRRRIAFRCTRRFVMTLGEMTTSLSDILIANATDNNRTRVRIAR
jgi:hypothetical protein